MKVAIITDQHFGARKSSRVFHEFFLKFYDQVFFPTLEERGITTVFDLGDTFDNRRQIDLWAAKWAREKYYNRCLLYTSPSPRDATLSRMPSSA